MKVLYVCPTTDLYGDGIALLNIMPFLINYGVDPLFVVPQKGRFSDELDKRNYRYYISGFGMYKTYKGNYSLKIWLAFRATYAYEFTKYVKLRKIIKEQDIKLIHTNSSTTYIGYRLSQDLFIPHVWHLREYGFLDHGWTHFPNDIEFLKRINSPMNYSISITKDIYKHYKYPSNGVYIHDGVFNKCIKPKIEKIKDNYFLFVGRLVETKGILDVIEAFLDYLSFSSTKCKLIIAGTGPLHNNIEQRINKLNMKEHIILLGYTKDVDILMSKAKSIIVSSQFEAFGFITAEAYLYGCPVIGRNTGGTKLQFDNALLYAGMDLSYRYNSIEELKKCMMEIDRINKDELYSKIQKAQECALNLYSSQDSASKVYDFYNKILL